LIYRVFHRCAYSESFLNVRKPNAFGVNFDLKGGDKTLIQFPRQVNLLMFEKIIDVHFHLGECRVSDFKPSEEDVLKLLKEYGFFRSYTSTLPGAFPQPPTHVHSKIAELSRKYEGRIYGMVSINPHVMEHSEWKREVKKWIKGYGFAWNKSTHNGTRDKPNNEGC